MQNGARARRNKLRHHHPHNYRFLSTRVSLSHPSFASCWTGAARRASSFVVDLRRTILLHFFMICHSVSLVTVHHLKICSRPTYDGDYTNHHEGLLLPYHPLVEYWLVYSTGNQFYLFTASGPSLHSYNLRNRDTLCLLRSRTIIKKSVLFFGTLPQFNNIPTWPRRLFGVSGTVYSFH